jgi:hypothetical protein
MVQTECKNQLIFDTIDNKIIMARAHLKKISEIKNSPRGENERERDSELVSTEAIAAITEEILNGKFITENINDKIKALVVHHYFNEGIENKYVDLITNLKKHPDELILIKRIEFHQKTNFFPKRKNSKDFIKTEQIQLGIIKPELKMEDINVQLGKISIADEAVSFEPAMIKLYPNNPNYFKKQDSLLIFWHDVPKIDQPTKKIDSKIAVGNKEPKIKIVIGNEEVQKELQSYHLNLEKLINSFPILGQHLKTPKT